MIVRDATRDDFLAFFGRPPPVTLRGMVAESSAGLVGFGGYYLLDGYAVAFTDHKGMSKRDMVRAGRAFMGHVKQLGVPVVATPGPEGDTALRHFGFTSYGPAYRLEHNGA